MRIHRVTFGSATVPLSLSRLTIWRGAAASFAARVSLWRSGRQIARFVEIIAFAILLALLALPAPARAQTFTMSSATAVPATVQPGKTVIFTDKITANQNASNYNFAFLLSAPGGSRVAQQYFTITAKAGVPLTEVYGWTVPAGSKPGTYTMETAVFNPGWSQILASKTIALTVTAASAMAYPTLLGAPVISGTAQVGDVLTSTTGTWSGATSFAYQWSGNKTAIAGATAAKYIPVASDAGHTLTSTVTATGSPGALSSATSAATVPIVAANSAVASTGGSKGVAFTALHTYFMSPTGSDSNNGLTAATAWKTPNHALVCGDVIIAAAGSYAAQSNNFGAVSSCPSTSGGIDGTGGVYFATLLCGGTYVGACSIVGTQDRDTGAGIELNANNWAIEGWAVSEGYNCSTSSGFGFMVDTLSSARKYDAFINDISYHNASGIGINAHGPAGNGADYLAFVGNIAQDSAGLCAGLSTGAIVLIGIESPTTTAGTHILLQGNYSYNNQQTLGASDNTDGECYMFDTIDYPAPGYGQNGQTIVFRDNIGAVCERFGFMLGYGGYNVTDPTIKIYNNTLVASNQMNHSTVAPGQTGDINLQGSSGAFPWNVSIYDNIVKENKANPVAGVTVYTIMTQGTSSIVIGGSGTQNELKGLSTSCTGGVCDPGHNATTYGASGLASLGTNNYVDPAFNDPSLTDLIANRIGTPNCTGFINTAACEGFNFGGSPTNRSLAYDLTATAAGAAGKGYQPPGPCVATDADYPTWLKGVVYLQWNGTSLTENSDLVTKPCKM